MNKRDRQIQIFLQLFYLIAGFYLAGLNIWKLNAELWPEGIFESYNGSIPIFTLAAGFIGGVLSLITSLFLWTRVSWAHGLSLFTSGLIMSYALTELGGILNRNPYHSIPLVLLVIVVLQSMPFLIRKASRQH